MILRVSCLPIRRREFESAGFVRRDVFSDGTTVGIRLVDTVLCVRFEWIDWIDRIDRYDWIYYWIRWISCVADWIHWLLIVLGFGIFCWWEPLFMLEHFNWKCFDLSLSQLYLLKISLFESKNNFGNSWTYVRKQIFLLRDMFMS